MKKTIIGIAMLLSATLFDIGILISASIIATNLNEWHGNYGKLGTSVSENGLTIPFIFANILFVLAIIILTKEYSYNSSK